MTQPTHLCVLSVLRFLADERDEIREGIVTVLLVFTRRVSPVTAATVAAAVAAAVLLLSVTAVLLCRHQTLIVTVVAGRGQRDHRTVLHRQT